MTPREAYEVLEEYAQILYDGGSSHPQANEAWAVLDKFITEHS